MGLFPYYGFPYYEYVLYYYQYQILLISGSTLLKSGRQHLYRAVLFSYVIPILRVECACDSRGSHELRGTIVAADDEWF